MLFWIHTNEGNHEEPQIIRTVSPPAHTKSLISLKGSDPKELFWPTGPLRRYTRGLSEVVKENRLVRRNGVYYFRARIPKDLVKAFNRREFEKSLGTSDRSEALKAVRIQSVKFDAEIEAMRRTVSTLVDGGRVLKDMRDDEIERIVIRWFAEKKREEVRLALPEHGTKEHDEAVANATEEMRITHSGDQSSAASVSATVCSMLIEAGIRTKRGEREKIGGRLLAPHRTLIEEDVTSQQFQTAYELIRRAMHELARRAHARLEGDYSVRVYDAMWTGAGNSFARHSAQGVPLRLLVDKTICGRPFKVRWKPFRYRLPSPLVTTCLAAAYPRFAHTLCHFL